MSGESVFEGELGTLDCVLLSLGGMVGSAIFVFPGSTGRLTGPSAVGAWLVAGVLMVAIADDCIRQNIESVLGCEIVADDE